MEELKRLRNSRKGYRTHLKSLLSKANDTIERHANSPAECNIPVLTDLRRQLQRKDDILSGLDSQIVGLIENEEELVEDIYEAEEIKASLSTTVAQIAQLLETRPPPTESQPVFQHTSVSNSDIHQPASQDIVQHVGSHLATETIHTEHTPPTIPRPNTVTSQSATRLPKLTIPVFSGDSLQWQSFWDCFQAAVDRNPSITEVQKLNYLRTLLQGSALRVITGLPLTNDSYQHSVILLKERYGEPHKLVDAHMQALIGLSNPANTLAALQLFHDSVEGHIRSLESLGTSQDQYEAMLVPIILKKLSPETRKNLARGHDSTQWTLTELQEAILREVHILEMGTDYSHQQGSLSTPTASFVTGTERQTHRKNRENQTRHGCVYCKGSHSPSHCTSITDKKKRIEIIKRDMLCFNCLGHHKISQCKSKFRCRQCNRRHHTSLCTESTPPTSSETNTATSTGGTISTPTTSSNTSTTITSNTTSLTTLSSEAPSSHQSYLLKTAVATVTSGHIEARANILFDEGSQRSFLTQELADALSLQPEHQEDICLSAFGSTHPLNKRMKVARIHIKTTSGALLPISTLVVPKIAPPLRNTVKLNINQLPHLRDLPLAHPITQDDSFKISLLIGTDYYWDLVEDHIIRGNGPTAMSSKLGYLLSGPLPMEHSLTTHTNVLHVSTHHNMASDLTQFWELESTGTNATPDSDTNKKFLTDYSNTHVNRQPDGSYCARLPWKPDHPPLPTNREICWKRARSLVSRLTQTPTLLETYHNIIMDQMKRGFIEKVTNTTDNLHTTHYIPHHCVKKNSVTTPIRIVYDCSCRQSSQQPSLNDCLLTGPHFLNDLCSILIRFRTHNYAVSTDIEKAFLHVTLHEHDRDYTRFFWLKDISDPKGPFDVYRFKRVLFGAVCSPFMLYATLSHHLQQHNTPISCDLLNNLYVDNVLSGSSSENEVVSYYHNARKLLSEACFNLRAWVTNSPQLRAITQQEKTADTVTPSNTLGILWNPISDQLSLSSKGPLTTGTLLTTKRELLQESSKVFDPLGIATPVTIQAKLLIQKIWTTQIEWDEPLGAELAKEWQQIADDLCQLHQYSIHRKYFPDFYTSCLTLHTFSDASIKAYGAIVYLSSKSQTAFVMAKSRVAPLKSQTLPRLELMAALVAARLTKFVMDSLKLTRIPIYVWVDSQIALYWIHSQKKLPQFVAHRVTEIHNLIPSASWKYCPSHCNPADLLTRGLSYTQFQSSSLWINGPNWLPNQQQWPQWDQSPFSHLHAVAAITDEFIPTAEPPSTGLHSIITVTRFSKLNKLLATTSYVYRFISNLRNPSEPQRGLLTPQELTQARLNWIYSCQQEVYWKELKNLSTPNQKRSLLVRQLRLFLDDKGYLRCGGRIHNAPLTNDTKFPYLLPPRHPFTALIVLSVHAQLHHAGVNHTVTSIRQSYWIPTARQYIRNLLHRCTICKRHGGRPYPAPDPAPLPKHRLQDLPPFSVTGVDFTGALHVHNNNGETKVYICLFTCANTRAIHLEIVTDLSTETFLLAFRRFASRKSCPHIMMSDNASTFTSAAEEITRLLQSETLTTSLSAHGVIWKFIPKKAPWFGGFWERLIGLTKASLKKTLGRSHINLPTLQTLIVEIEAVLNERPLTYTPSDISDAQPLTPAHLLYGRKITRLPHENYADDISDSNYDGRAQLHHRAKTLAHLLQCFQSRWKHEYLTTLREYHRSTGQNNQTISVGDVVIVHDEGPRVTWRLAVITKLLVGGDGLTRAAEIRTSTGLTNRPIIKLYPLEVHSDEFVNKTSPTLTGEADDIPSTIQQPEIENQVDRPVRQSARRATEQMTRWIETLRAPPEDVVT